MIPLFLHDNEAFVLLTKRADHLNSHGGEVCFPGGKFDEEDSDLLNTALREAEEEIGLKPSNVEILSELFPIRSKSGIAVYSFVGVIKNLEKVLLNINHQEVQDVFACPLQFFINSQTYKLFHAHGHRFHSYLWENNVRLNDEESKIDFLKQVFCVAQGKTFSIWGLTAYFSLLTAAICLEQPPTFKSISYTLDELINDLKQYLRRPLQATPSVLTKL